MTTREKLTVSPVVAVIPARYEASRLPGKPLCLLEGHPLLLHVINNLRQCHSIEHLLVATDDERIVACCQQQGIETFRSQGDHRSGTERIAEAIEQLRLPHPWILNVQVDEPFLEPHNIEQLLLHCSAPSPKASLVTLCRPIASWEEYEDPHTVKVVFNTRREALYFSRSPLPSHPALYQNRSLSPQKDLPKAYAHLGVYLYQRETLLQLVSSPPSPLEEQESLEQLRALEQGIPIQLLPVASQSFGIDTPRDLQRAQQRLRQQP